MCSSRFLAKRGRDENESFQVEFTNIGYGLLRQTARSGIEIGVIYQSAVVRNKATDRNYTQSFSVPLPEKAESGLMFYLTIFPRCFSRLTFFGNRATTTSRKAISITIQQRSFLLRRTMASASGSGEGEKPKHMNRLQHSKSPYLLQHKHNPVDW